MQIGPSRVGTLKVQVMDGTRVTDKRMTTRCTNTIDIATGQRDVSGSSGCKWPWEIVRKEIILCQCTSHFWNLPCVYPTFHVATFWLRPSIVRIGGDRLHFEPPHQPQPRKTVHFHPFWQKLTTGGRSVQVQSLKYTFVLAQHWKCAGYALKKYGIKPISS